MKRFYKTATTAGGQVLLDGKPLKTKGGAMLETPTPVLADAIAAEWDAQGETVNLAAMPLYRLAVTTLDWTIPHRDDALAEVVEYVEGDLLCYRATEPEELVAYEAGSWNPLLEWATERFDAAWTVATGVLPVAQSARVHEAMKHYAEALDGWRLTAYHHLVKRTASPVLASAMLEGLLEAETAFTTAFLGELYQARKWGEDTEAAARRDAIRTEMRDLTRWLQLLNEA